MPETVTITADTGKISESFVTEPIILDKLAPDFTAQGYHQGKKASFKLSDFRNKWVVLLFYADDFTFV